MGSNIAPDLRLCHRPRSRVKTSTRKFTRRPRSFFRHDPDCAAMRHAGVSEAPIPIEPLACARAILLPPHDDRCIFDHTFVWSLFTSSFLLSYFTLYTLLLVLVEVDK